MNERQQKFLDVLFEEAAGDPKVAKTLAGYADGTPVSVIMKPIQKEIGEKLKESLGTLASIKSYQAMLSVLEGTDNPLGRKERIQVARDLLDRAGHKATDKVEVEVTNPVFILPPKNDS